MKYTSKNGYNRYHFWNTKLEARALNHWEIEATIERLDKGGGGVMFAGGGKRIAAYVGWTKIFLVDFTNTYQAITIAEAPLSKSQYKPGPMVLKVELFRNTNIVKCYVNGNECLNYDVTKKQFTIPVIEQYGFFMGAYRIGASKSTFKTTSIFRKMNVRVGD